MIAPKFKKEVGFIKSQSSKKLFQINSRASEDSFSSFEGANRADGSDQFSPYKHPDHSRRKYVSPKHLASPKQGYNREVLTQKTNTRNEYTSHQPHGDNFFKEFQQNKNKLKQTINEEIKQVQKICRNIDQKIVEKRDQSVNQRIDQRVITKIEQHVERLPQKYPPKQTNNFIAKNATRDKFKQNEQVYDKYIIEKEYTMTSKGKAKPAPLSSDSESQNDQLKYTREEIRRNNRVKEREKPYNFESDEESYSVKEDDQELVMDYDKKEFVGGKSLKRAIMENVRPECRTEGMYQTKGGVCFDLDVHEFHSPAIAPVRVETRPARRKVEINSKEEILKRRQMAKVYDRKARFKLFGFN